MPTIQEMSGQLNEITIAYRRSCILFTALNADVFSQLQKACTADEVAAALNWDPRGTRMLLDGLVALKLVNKQDGRYSNAEIAAECLIPGKPHYQGHIIRHNQGAWDAWARLPEAVASGDAVPRARPERSPEELRAFICGMNDIAQFSAQDVLKAVDVSPYQSMLDVGGGPGTFSIAFLNANPRLQATLIDHPDVVDIAEEQVRAAGLVKRVSFIRGDFLQTHWGSNYDLVFISNIIHSYGDEKNRDIVQRAYNALAPRGTIIIKDFLVDNDRSGPPYSLIFALHMLIHCGEGDTYPYSSVDIWTREAGFINGRAVPITEQSRLWIAEKP